MATKAPKEAPTDTEVNKALEPFSNALSKSVAQIWNMFVMRYVAKGISEIFIAVFITGCGFYYLSGQNRLWTMIPLLVSGLFVFDAIQLLMNPYYFAMNDVALRLKSEQLLWKK